MFEKIPKAHLSVYDLTQIAFMSAVICVCAWITIPVQIPFTMQFFGIFFAVCTLGGVKGFISVCVYIMLGLTGLPVFSGFKGGAGVLLGTTGGYIVGFLFIPLSYIIVTAVFGDKLPAVIASLIIGMLLCYAFGTVWFMIAYAKKVGAIGIISVLQLCVVPFIIPDCVKMVLAVVLSRRIKRIARIK